MTWILRASDRDRDISLRFRYGHWREVNHLCPSLVGHRRFTDHWSVANLRGREGLFVIVFVLVIKVNTGDLLVAGVGI